MADYTPYVKRYNAKDCVVSVDGQLITGFGEDMISWEKEEAFFEPVVGAMGDVVKSEINNNIHNLTLTIQSVSPSFKTLVALKNRADSFPVWVTNKSLGITIGGSKANIMEMPEISLGAEAEDVEITFCVFDGQTKVE